MRRGLGKTHLPCHAACLKGYAVLFATAVDVINTLAAAQNAGRLKQELNKYIKPMPIILDEMRWWDSATPGRPSRTTGTGYLWKSIDTI